MADNRVIIACSMLEYELKKVMDEHNVDYPVIWLERGLHEKPEKLREALREEINRQAGAEYIMLAYGLCGNAAVGLSGGNSVLVVPKFDDCIRMLLSMEKGEAPDVSARCMYFTRGWVESERFLLREVDEYYEKYGEEKAEIIINAMFKNYLGLRLIDTGAYNTEDYMGILNETAGRLNMDTGICKGTVRVLEKLVTGQWDDEFCVVPRGGQLSYEDFWRL